MKALLATASLAAFGLLSTTAAAETVNFCIEHTGEYTDNNVGEDYWLTDQPRLARGAYVRVEEDDDVLFQGYLGDGLGVYDPGTGCTGPITVPTAAGTYDLFVYSYGVVNYNNVYSRDDSGNIWGGHGAYTWVGGSGTRTVEMAWAFGVGYMVFNVYQAGAYAMYRHRGGLGYETFTYWTGPSITNTWYNRDHNRIEISGNPTNGSGRWDEKFVIVHEAGHRMAHLRTQGVMNDAQDYSVSEWFCPGEPAGQQHSMRSIEYSGAAAGEGFAHFYAADVWNDHDETDCWFEYYKRVGTDDTPLVNCELGNGAFTLARLETDCYGWNNHGTELDWLRTFWDVHTDGAAPDPSFTSIMNWLDTADPWSRTTAYDELDAEADDVGGELNSNWDVAKVRNGVDH